MEVDCDLLVAGGGPAGTSAAITAARCGARVLLLEQGQFPRHKVCGEFVSAECLQLLSTLLGPRNSALMERANRVTRARFYLGRTCARFSIPACAAISRYELDQALWEAAIAAGARGLQQVRVERIEPGFRVHSSEGEIRCRQVIVAAGRWSKLRPIRVSGPKWLGIKAHFQEDNAAQSTDLYFSNAGYCGVQPLSPTAVNVCAMVRADSASTFEDVFELHPALRERAASWTRLMEPVTTSPLVFAEPAPAGDDVLFAGDAAGFIDPFAGDGISLALRTGAAAAECAWETIRGAASAEQSARTYQERYRRQFLPAFRNASRARRLLTAPGPIGPLVLQLMNVPPIARFWFTGTRGRLQSRVQAHSE